MHDHDARSYELIARAFAGQQEGLTRVDILDNITLYVLTRGVAPLLGNSPQRVNQTGHLFAPTGVKIPVAVSAYSDELYTAPRSWTEQA